MQFDTHQHSEHTRADTESAYVYIENYSFTSSYMESPPTTTTTFAGVTVVCIYALRTLTGASAELARPRTDVGDGSPPPPLVIDILWKKVCSFEIWMEKKNRGVGMS